MSHLFQGEILKHQYPSITSPPKGINSLPGEQPERSKGRAEPHTAWCVGFHLTSFFLVATQLHLPLSLAFSTKEAGRFHFSTDKTGHFHQAPWRTVVTWLSRMEKATRGIRPLNIQTSHSVFASNHTHHRPPRMITDHRAPGPLGFYGTGTCNATSFSVSEEYVLDSGTQNASLCKSFKMK